jgi:tetratricopeptide (TPR) repeat protein
MSGRDAAKKLSGVAAGVAGLVGAVFPPLAIPAAAIALAPVATELWPEKDRKAIEAFILDADAEFRGVTAASLGEALCDAVLVDLGRALRLMGPDVALGAAREASADVSFLPWLRTHAPSAALLRPAADTADYAEGIARRAWTKLRQWSELESTLDRTTLAVLVTARDELQKGLDGLVRALEESKAIHAGRFGPLLSLSQRPPKPGTSAAASRLLRASSAVVPFVDRDGALSRLDAWVHDGIPFAIQVIGGSGGAGKTRLGVELAYGLTEAGVPGGQWLAGFLESSATTEGIVALANVEAPRLVVVDYAESRVEQVGTLLELMQPSATPRKPVRVILLVRRPAAHRTGQPEAAVWVDATRPYNRPRADALLDEATTLVLDQLPLDMTLRHSLYDAALEAFGQREPSTGYVDLTDDMYSQPLVVVMAGYLTSHGADHLPATRSEMYDAILDHECRYWLPRAEAAGLELSTRQMRLGVAVATLVDPIDATEALTILGMAGDLAPVAAKVDEWLQSLYLRRGTEHWGRLEPDRLGEYVVAALLTDASLLSWALSGERLTHPSKRTAADRILRTLTVLARASADYEDLANRVALALNDQLTGLVRVTMAQANDPDRYQAGDLQLPEAVQGLLDAVGERLDLGVLMAASNACGTGNRLLSGLWLGINTALVQLSRTGAVANPTELTPTLASALTNYAIGLSAIGRREEAVAPAEEALNLFRVLEQKNQGRFTPDLATVLNNYANRLWAVGRWDEALASAEECLELYRVLGQTNPVAFAADLAMALTNYATLLSTMGRWEESVAAAEDAVTMRRALAQSNSARFKQDLATALTNYASLLSTVGRWQEALAPGEEGLELYRVLAQANPARFKQDLATALINHSNRLSEFELRDEALGQAEEALKVYRGLAQANAAVFTPDLVTALTIYASRLSAVGRDEGALAPAEEALKLIRGLAQTNPARFTPDLAMVLNNFASLLSQTGHPAEALAPAEEALTLYRGLAKTNPAALTPDLATAMSTYAIVLSEVGLLDESLATAAEALNLRRVLAQTNPVRFTPTLAKALVNYANRLSAVGRDEGSLAPAEEALKLFRGLAETDPARFTPDLAMALNNFGTLLSQTGHPAEAFALAEEALTLYRGLAKTNPAAFTPDLATAMSTYAIALSEVGLLDESLAIAEEALNLCRVLAQTNPVRFTLELATASTDYANGLSAVGRAEEALAPAEEGLRLYLGLAKTNPAAFAPVLATALTNYASLMDELGRSEDAEAVRGQLRLLPN